MKRFALSILLGAALVGTGAICATQVLVFEQARQAALAKDQASYRDVVKKVLPAVVSIEAKPRLMTTHMGLPGDMAPHARAFGSGFVVDPSGVVLTNDHVIHDAAEVVVHLQDGRSITSRDFRKDPKSDLAVVRLRVKEPLPFLPLGNSDQMEVGDRVLAVGAPLGLTGTVTSGIISAKSRDVHMNVDEDFLQTDAAINPGNSGGPLVNLAGEVVGINSAIKSQTGGFQGIGLAISSNLARGVMEQLLKDGVVHRGYLGVQTRALDSAVAAHLGLEGRGGVVIAKVMPGTPAAKGGLQDGDILTEMAGQLVKDPRSLQRIVEGLPAGKHVELTVLRDGTNMKLEMTLEEQPQAFAGNGEPSEPGSVSLCKIGVSVTDLTAEKAKELGYPEKTTGVLITDVDANSVADGAGLRSGTLVLKVDQHPVNTAEAFRKAVEKASLDEGVLLQVRTLQGGTSFVLLKAPAPQ